MTVIRPTSITGITSLTCTSDSLAIHNSSGALIQNLVSGGITTVTGFSASGVSTLTGGVNVGTAATISANGNATFSGIVTVSTIGNATDTLTIPGNLTVQGTRTIINTDELNINDKLVGIASTATPSSLSQDNAGIIIYGKHNVDFKYEVKKAAVGLNTALCVAGIVTAMSGLNVDTTAGQGINVGTAATISANGNATFSGISTFAHAALTGTSESVIFTQAASAGGTTDIEFETADNFIITMGGNTSITAGNQKVGQTGSIFMVQDGTGSRTASWHADFKWTGGTAPTLTTTASAIDRIDYFVKASNQIHAVASLDVK